MEEEVAVVLVVAHGGCQGEKDAPLDPGGVPQCLRISVARLASCAQSMACRYG